MKMNVLRLVALGVVLVACTASADSRAADPMEALLQTWTEGDNQAGSFDLLLKGMGLQNKATGQELEAAAQRLSKTWPSHAFLVRQELREAIRAGINPGRAEAVIRAGLMLQPVLGYGSTQRLVWAIHGGVGSLSELVRQLNLVTEREIAQAREDARHGNETPYINRWWLLIEQRAASLYGTKHNVVVPAAPTKKVDPNAFDRLLRELETHEKRGTKDKPEALYGIKHDAVVPPVEAPRYREQNQRELDRLIGSQR